MSARTLIQTQLVALLPKTYRVVPIEKRVGSITRRPVVVIRQKATRPAPEGIGFFLVDLTLTVATPITNLDAAEDALDDILVDIDTALAKVPWVRWTDATKVIYQDMYPALDFTLEAVTQRKATP
ncbi:hypothetical protein [Glaciibacter flavus]|uniref:hypothetical protein n=1 Tax=Orlajensenia flava TaxID=2565934 RepID=UPI003B003CC5